jgi:hypothetical protein
MGKAGSHDRAEAGRDSPTLTAVIIKPVGRGVPFHPDHIVPVFRESDTME